MLAGALYNEAWVEKVDAAGKSVWRYKTDYANKSEKTINNHPIFSSAILLPDESVLLLGQRRIQSGARYPAVLVHLDKSGQFIGETSYFPSSPQNDLSGSLSISATTQSGYIVAGTTVRTAQNVGSSPTDPGPLNIEFNYWVIKIRADGSVEWERLIPADKKLASNPILDSIQILKNGEIVLLAKRSGSEIIKLAPNGDIKTQRIVDQNYQFINARPLMPDNNISLVSYNLHPLIKIMLDQDLKEISRTIEQKYDEGYITVAYRLPSNSFILFGNLSGRGNDFVHAILVNEPLGDPVKYILKDQVRMALNVEVASPVNQLNEIVSAHILKAEKPEEWKGLSLSLFSIKPTK